MLTLWEYIRGPPNDALSMMVDFTEVDTTGWVLKNRRQKKTSGEW